jgi:hypothetical protein
VEDPAGSPRVCVCALAVAASARSRAMVLRPAQARGFDGGQRRGRRWDGAALDRAGLVIRALVRSKAWGIAKRLFRSGARRRVPATRATRFARAGFGAAGRGRTVHPASARVFVRAAAGVLARAGRMTRTTRRSDGKAAGRSGAGWGERKKACAPARVRGACSDWAHTNSSRLKSRMWAPRLALDQSARGKVHFLVESDRRPRGFRRSG